MTGAVERGLEALARLARKSPWGRRLRAACAPMREHVYRTVAGTPLAVDVHVPRTPPPWPLAVYLHGGGFTMLSRHSHWHAGAQLAAGGHLTLVPDYRLAPRHPFPAALEDVLALWAWAHAEGPALGAQTPVRAALLGESAGANLAASLAWLACGPPLRSGWAAAAGAAVPRLVLPLCGLLSFSRRVRGRGPVAAIARWRVAAIRRKLLGQKGKDPPAAAALASPLELWAGSEPLARPPPPWAIWTGGRDPLHADSVDLAAALRARGVAVSLHEAAGAGHAYPLWPWHPQAAAAWAGMRAALAAHP